MSKNSFFNITFRKSSGSVVEDQQILEIIILEQLLLSRVDSMELNEIMEEFDLHFTPAFDPEPRPSLSIAGWLNYNYGQSFERETDHLIFFKLISGGGYH